MADKFPLAPRLTPEERNQHVQNLRRLADLLPSQRAELLRYANNLLAAGRIRQRIADRNQHRQHPTKQ